MTEPLEDFVPDNMKGPPHLPSPLEKARRAAPAWRFLLYVPALLVIAAMVMMGKSRFAELDAEISRDLKRGSDLDELIETPEMKAAGAARIKASVAIKMAQHEQVLDEIRSRAAAGESHASIMADLDRRKETARQEAILKELKTIRRDLERR